MESVKNEILLNAIGTVHNTRELIADDNWGEVVSEIKIDSDILEESCLGDLEKFSLVNVIFYMHKVRNEKICTGSRHPRNNQILPKVGILAQRAKSRVNKIGLTICAVEKVDKYSLFVKGLDAINGTPVLDIKPVMRQFLPKSEIKQPAWVNQIMKEYF